MQNRTENVEMVLGEYEGIKVPRNAIRFKDVEETVTDEETGEEKKQTVNCRGVYVQDGEKSNSGVWMWFMREMIMFSQSSTQAMVI